MSTIMMHQDCGFNMVFIKDETRNILNDFASRYLDALFEKKKPPISGNIVVEELDHPEKAKGWKTLAFRLLDDETNPIKYIKTPIKYVNITEPREV